MFLFSLFCLCVGHVKLSNHGALFTQSPLVLVHKADFSDLTTGHSGKYEHVCLYRRESSYIQIHCIIRLYVYG